MLTTLKQRFALLQERNPDISQADLARATGAKPPSVNAWFTGDTKSMKADTASKVAALYGVNPVWLATGEGEIDDFRGVNHTNYPNGREAGDSVKSQNSAPVFDWVRIEEVLFQSNNNFASEPHLPVPPGAPEKCKWFTLTTDHPRFRLSRGHQVAVSPVEQPKDCRDGQLHLFKTPAGAYMLADFRMLANGYEAIPDSGLPMDSDRHGIQVVGRVHGSWFND